MKPGDIPIVNLDHRAKNMCEFLHTAQVRRGGSVAVCANPNWCGGICTEWPCDRWVERRNYSTTRAGHVVPYGDGGGWTCPRVYVCDRSLGLTAISYKKEHVWSVLEVEVAVVVVVVRVVEVVAVVVVVVVVEGVVLVVVVVAQYQQSVCCKRGYNYFSKKHQHRLPPVVSTFQDARWSFDIEK